MDEKKAHGGKREGAGRRSKITLLSKRKLRSLRADDREWKIIKKIADLVKTDCLGSERMFEEVLKKHKDCSGLALLQILYCHSDEIKEKLDRLWRGEQLPISPYITKLDLENRHVAEQLQKQDLIEIVPDEGKFTALKITQKGINYLKDDLDNIHRGTYTSEIIDAADKVRFRG